MYQFKHAFKGIFKDKIHSILNIIGFAIGLTCSILVFLYVQKVLTYDKHHEKYERIYRYGVGMTIGDVYGTQSICNMGVGPLLKDYMKGIENYVRTGSLGEILIKKGETSFKEEDFIFMDSSVFHVFTYDFIYGDSKSALKEPNQIVLTKSVSRKYFGDENPIGKFLDIEEIGSVKIVGVIDDPKENSIIEFRAILSFSTLLVGKDEYEMYSPRRFSSEMSYKLYFLFRPGYTEKDFMDEFQNYYDEFMAEYDGIKYESIVEPISKVYLHSKIWPEWSENNRKFLYGFISIGIFILLLACINYINIASSTAITRTKEIAIKKVLGSSKLQLISQILSESVFLCVLSLIASFALAEFVLVFTPFNKIIGTELNISYSNSMLLIVSFTITILVGILSGLFPALFLAGIAPSKTLYGKNNGKASKGNVRNVLISIQLIISIAAIILSLLMKNQISFILNKDLGFDKENVVVLKINDEQVRNRIKSFKDELTQFHGIESISFSNATPGFAHTGFAFKWESEEGEMQGHAFASLGVDFEYFKTLGIELAKGTFFTRPKFDSDSTIEFLVNERLVETMGWTNPIGKRNEYNGIVVGVVKDYNYGSLHEEIRPLFIYQENNRTTLLNIKIKKGTTEESIKYIEKLWSTNLPDYEFSYTFLDDKIAFFYENDMRQKKLSNIFSILCILISALGLFSMISLANARKIKEVAIRKVHGASEVQILMILYKNIFYLICIASVLAIPIVYKIYAIWALNYTYKAAFTLIPYLISILGAIAISSIISISYSLKVARSNPVDSLKYE